MSRFLSSRYRTLEPYTPGEQPQGQPYVKLNTNESPYPPSDGVLAAAAGPEAGLLNRYPDPDARKLSEAIARQYGVAPENVFPANGSDDILNFCFLALCSDGVLCPEVSYGFYQVYANLHRVDYRTVPMRPDLSFDPAMFRRAGRTVVLANPNAQTGIALSRAEIESIVQANPDHPVIVDEAYVDFGAESAVPLTERYDNLLVVQTFSKSRSMAGARLGFAIGDAALIDDLRRIQYATNPYSLNRLTQAAGIAALADQAYYDGCCRKIEATRENTRRSLTSMGFVCTPSQANFLLARSPRIAGGTLYRQLKARGILVRHFSDPLLVDSVRITIGTPEQMEALLRETAALLGLRREGFGNAIR